MDITEPEAIAYIAHSAVRTLRALTGEAPLPEWDQTDPNLQAEAIGLVEFYIINPQELKEDTDEHALIRAITFTLAQPEVE